MLPSLGPLELGIILVIVILIFGAGKLPELGGALGKTLREFKSATKEVDEIKDSVTDSVSLDASTKTKSESTEKKAAG